MIKDPMLSTSSPLANQEPASGQQQADSQQGPELPPQKPDPVEPPDTAAPQETSPPLPADAQESDAAPEHPEPEPETPDSFVALEEDALTDTEQQELQQNESAPVEGKENKKADQAEAKRQVEYGKIIDSKQYFVPINAVQQRHALRTALLSVLVILLVIVAMGDALLDAGVLMLENIPHTHFLNQ